MTRESVQQEPTLPLDAARQVDRLCDAFEAAWTAGTPPKIEDYLLGTSETLRRELVRELVQIDLYYRRRSGESPQTSDYSERFRELETVWLKALIDVAGPSRRERHGISRATNEIVHGPPPLNSGDVLGNYRIARSLGRGGMGWVYLAHDELLKIQVAIKVPDQSLFHTTEQEQQFLEEAQAAARFRHPAIVPVLYFGRESENGCYFVMEFIDGPSLAAKIKNESPPLNEAVRIMAQVAVAVGAIHREGFVHRDLKPANILLDAKGQPHVADFGLALHESAQAGRTGELSGTAEYMSPEQVERKANWLDGRTDVWSLGVILYEMLTKRRPFGGESRPNLFKEIRERDPKPPRSIEPEVPAELERICLKCLAKSPADRYPTADDLAADLCRWLQPSQSRKLVRRVVVVLALAAAVGIAIALPRRIGDRGSARTALNGTFDLKVWNSADRSRKGISLANADSFVPLRANDWVRVDVKLNRPAYIYLVWIDSQGNAQPVYPWTKLGDWRSLPAGQQPQERISVPAEADEGWPVAGPAGMETLLLLARDEPLPADVDLGGLLGQLPTLPAAAERSLAWFDASEDARNGRAGESSQERLLGSQGQIDDAVLRAHREIQKRIGQHFTLIRAVSVASRGG